MTNTLFKLNSLLELHPRRAAKFCDEHLDAASLVEYLEAWDPFGRKALCEYLGIGESTLSGWIKEGRIPQMAKNSFVLLLANQHLAKEVRKLRAELTEARAKDLKVVRNGASYQVCEFEKDEDGQVIGRVVADQIASIADARLLASGHRALRLAQKTTERASQIICDLTEEPDIYKVVKEIERKWKLHELLITNYDKWKKESQPEVVDLSEIMKGGTKTSDTSVEAGPEAGEEGDRD